jgi:hypothetical protein
MSKKQEREHWVDGKNTRRKGRKHTDGGYALKHRWL